MPIERRTAPAPGAALLALSAAVLSWLGCAGPPASDQGQWGELKLAPCQVHGVEEELLCGKLSVPENRGNPQGRRIGLHVVVVPALARDEGAAPLFDLAGGPGMAASGSAVFYANQGSEYRRRRDVVLVDQRGTGQSHPLRCPELESLGPLEGLYRPQAVSSCRDELLKSADLTQYTTAASAQDLDDVRQALGYDRIDLFGLSYGTRLALVYMRTFPERVRSAVLVGTVPMNMKPPLHHARNAQRTLDRVFQECASDAGCSAAFPELRREWAILLARLEKAPLRVSKVGPAGKEIQVEIRRDAFGEALRGMLYTVSGIRRLPFVVHAMQEGDFRPFLSALPQDGGAFAEGLYLSISCSEDTGRILPEEVEPATSETFPGDYRVRAQMRACELWPKADIPQEFFQPVTSSIPTLLISGSLDPVTPSSWAEEVSRHLADSRHIDIEGMSHLPEGMENVGCLDRVILDFYTSGSWHSLDLSCMDGLKPPPFVLAEEI